MEKSYPRNTCACFTGHRAISVDDMRSSAELISEQIRALRDEGIVNYYAGGALGFDFAASVTLLNMKNIMPELTLNLVLPCHDYDKKWAKNEKELFSRVIARADTVVYTSEHYSNFCMHLRNRYMVDRSSVCIAYMTENKGGTASTVDYARKKGLRIINIAKPYGDQINFFVR